MNTRKQVFIMTALLLMMLMIVAVYAAWYPSRAEQLTEEFEARTIERAALVFARNCTICHGDVAEGGAAAFRLPAAPALNRPDLQGFSDTTARLTEEVTINATSIEVDDGDLLSEDQIILIGEERMRVRSVDGNTVHVERAIGHTRPSGHFPDSRVMGFDAADLAEQVTMLTNVIACGRVGTAMPPWSRDHGGPLNDEQIRQLVVLITSGHWQAVAHEVDVEDFIDVRLTEPLDAEATEMQVTDVLRFVEGTTVRLNGERIDIVQIPDVTEPQPGTVVVERGVKGTFPVNHGTDASFYIYPDAPEPSVLQISCGQIARPAAPAGTPGLIEPFEGQTVEIVAFGIMFDMDEIRVQSDGQVRLRLDNQDVGVDHNIAVRMSATDSTPVAPGSVGLVFEGPGVDDTAFDIPDPGEYFFICDVHPGTMTGRFIVE